jgi:CHAT domain-containing protein/Flp pilus assembly protein TadD
MQTPLQVSCGLVVCAMLRAGAPTMIFTKAVSRPLFGQSAAFLFALSLLSIPAFAPQESVAKTELQHSGHSMVQPGVVLEKFDGEFDGPKKIGMEPGDVLLTWSRGNAGGKLESPFDLSLVVSEELVQGAVTFEGLRGSEKKVWTLTSPWWGSIMRPNFSETAAAAYSEGAKLVAEGKPLEAVVRWRTLGARIATSEFSWVRPWLLYRCAETLAQAHALKEADAAYQDATELELGPASKAEILMSWGWNLYQRSDWDRAIKYFELTLAENQKAGAKHLVARTFDGLGFAARGRGDLSKAEQMLRQSLEILARIDPENLSTAESYINMGMIHIDLGNAAASEDYLRKALRIYQKTGSPTNGEAFTWDDLAEVALMRGDLPRAEKYFRNSLAMEEKVDPGTLSYATILSDLARTLVLREHRQEAEQLLLKSLSIEAKLAPGSPEEADSRENLGDLALHRGNLNAAEEEYRQALAIREKLSPQGLGAARALSGLGDIAIQRGDLSQAEADHRRALAIREKLTPGRTPHADSLAALAGIMRRKGQLEQAASYYDQALAALESQTASLGGSSEERAGYRGRHSGFYLDYVDLLISRQEVERAFDTLERWRGRTLLEMLAGAHVDIRQGVDPPLLQRAHILQVEVKAKSQRRINLLGEKDSAEQLKALEKEISDLTAEYEMVEGQIRYNSPAYAALVQPQPLKSKQVQELLDQDTVLLEYSLGQERSHLFVVTPDSLQAFELPKRAVIEKSALAVYQSLTERRRQVAAETPEQKQRRWARAEAAYPPAVAELSRLLLDPVAKPIRGKRLLVVADGSLHYVPFAILPDPATLGSSPEVLIANHEIVNLPSASVLALLRAQKKSRLPAPKAVAVLADPVFAKDDTRVTHGGATPARAIAQHSGQKAGTQEDALDTPGDSSLVRSTTDLGLNRHGRLELPRLRSSRLEADAILAVTPPGSGLKAIDFQASRATATSSELSQYRIVHFATHGLLNSEHPELSGLVLSLVDKNGKPQEGFLELQDIYNMNLSADLVVLSACETGLGKQISGEGLIGMTRGFMYAGASRVVASLWNVSDVATAQLMGEFYRAMEKDHQTPAAALRAAQLQMLKQKRWRSPYYWAAFQIQGEWK